MERFRIFLLTSLLSSFGLTLSACEQPPTLETDSTPDTKEEASPLGATPKPDETLPSLPYLFVGIIDSGIEADHPAFSHAFASGKQLSPFFPDEYRNKVSLEERAPGWDLIGDSAESMDRTGHGSHVAGIVAEAVCGPESPVRLLVIRSGDRIHKLEDVSKSLALIDGLKSSGLSIPILLLPLEYYRHGKDDDAFDRFQKILEKVSATTLIVTAAGNKGINNDGPMAKSAFPSTFPLPHLLSVACTNDSGHLHPKSNYGSSSVDLGAPGFGIESAWLKGERQRSTGTSQAAAIVAARAVAIRRDAPDVTPLALRAALLKECRLHPSLLRKVVSNGFLPRKSDTDN